MAVLRGGSLFQVSEEGPESSLGRKKHGLYLEGSVANDHTEFEKYKGKWIHPLDIGSRKFHHSTDPACSAWISFKIHFTVDLEKEQELPDRRRKFTLFFPANIQHSESCSGIGEKELYYQQDVLSRNSGSWTVQMCRNKLSLKQTSQKVFLWHLHSLIWKWGDHSVVLNLKQ
ncbi:hypothetical protein AVEN_198346-1 [Araneus ventricosus]|uniref:Uncharacterized protein n=1 Tax=Araneus ventricosus TaxID=182803 RepID=A0A4Y2U205_ARAVE|nr:hypothetical protein AVEN_198346-1 [Araneus ventricosus]